ncbi:MAG: HAD family hydrolase [Candidatus Aminicenantales bacterium]
MKGAIFDMDGTIVDVPYDWPLIKAELGAQGVPILTFISGLSEPERAQKWKILQKYENEATRKAVLKKGMRQFLAFLRDNGIRTALVTNNSGANVRFLLKKFSLAFDCILSRESGFWKPSGAPLRAALERLDLHTDECCAIGDSHFDVKAAEDAGIERIFILNNEKGQFSSLPVEIFSDVGALQKRMKEWL